MSSIDIGTENTLAFISKYLEPGISVLDVGCGDGKLASALIERHFNVTAIDFNSDAVEKANARGVPALLADFLTYDPQNTFDVIVFSRSLHHIQPLDVACSKIHKLLNKDGYLLLDEFAPEKVDEPSAAWFYSLLSILMSVDALESRHELPATNNYLDLWKHHHFTKHSVTPAETLLSQLDKQFDLLKKEDGPYFYRYFAPQRENSDLAARVLEWEKLLLSQNKLQTIGLRAAFQKTASFPRG